MIGIGIIQSFSLLGKNDLFFCCASMNGKYIGKLSVKYICAQNMYRV
jgi:hypothetical protein